MLKKIISKKELQTSTELPIISIKKNEIIVNNFFKKIFMIYDAGYDCVNYIISKIDMSKESDIIFYNSIKYYVKVIDKGNDIKNIIFISMGDEKKDKRIKYVVGYAIVDNFIENVEIYEMDKKSELTATVDKKINSFFKNKNTIIEKYSLNKYFILVDYDEFLKLKENKFKLLDDIKTISSTKGVPITLSIGFGLSRESLNLNKENAIRSLNLSLSRGGDQVVILDNKKFEFFGGKSEEVVSSNRVEGRIKTQLLENIIKSVDKVIIMGHKKPDMDCLGASMGIAKIVKSIGIEVHIVLGTVTSSVAALYERTILEEEYDENIFIRGGIANKICDKDTLLIVVDVNKKKLVEYESILDKTDKIALIDHHRKEGDSIENTIFKYHSTSASSTSELVIDFIKYTSEKINLLNVVSDGLLAGMIIDTKHFTSKTSAKTFENAAFIKEKGANITRVQKMLKENLEEYKIKTNIVSNVNIYSNVAISYLLETVENVRLTIAQAADDILNLEGIECCFVISQENEKIYISARSAGRINVQVLMEKLGGGGHRTVAAAVVENISLDEVEKKILVFFKEE